jgi:prevent-host-death family protein
MTKQWPLQDAKNKLSELVRTVKDQGPQIITVHGKEEAVLVSRADYEKVHHLLEQKPGDFVDFLLSIPRGGSDDEDVFERIKVKGRKIDL